MSESTLTVRFIHHRLQHRPHTTFKPQTPRSPSRRNAPLLERNARLLVVERREQQKRVALRTKHHETAAVFVVAEGRIRRLLATFTLGVAEGRQRRNGARRAQ